MMLQQLPLLLLALLWRQAVQHCPSAVALWGCWQVTRMVLLVLLVLLAALLLLLVLLRPSR